MPDTHLPDTALPDLGRLLPGWLNGTTPDPGELARATQFTLLTTRPSVPGDLREAPTLPPPTLAVPADRARVRRVARALPTDLLLALLRLLAGRGYQTHPFDWLPGRLGEAEAGLPAAYRPWLAWQRGSRPGQGTGDPRELLASSDLPVAQRFSLLQAIAADPRPADLPLLGNLLDDRSDRVRRLAVRLRARLGERDPVGDPEEIIAWFTVQRGGLVRRGTTVTLAPLREPRRGRRAAGLGERSWGDLAEALGIGEVDLARAWRPSGPDDALLLACAADSAPGAVVEALLATALAGPAPADGAWLPALVARLSAPAARAVLHRTITHESRFGCFGALAPLLPLTGSGELTDLDLPELAASPLWRFGRRGKEPVDVVRELAVLAALLPQRTALDLADDLIRRGMEPADPALDPVLLNATTTHRSIEPIAAEGIPS